MTGRGGVAHGYRTGNLNRVIPRRICDIVGDYICSGRGRIDHIPADANAFRKIAIADIRRRRACLAVLRTAFQGDFSIARQRNGRRGGVAHDHRARNLNRVIPRRIRNIIGEGVCSGRGRIDRIPADTNAFRQLTIADIRRRRACLDVLRTAFQGDFSIARQG